MTRHPGYCRALEEHPVVLPEAGQPAAALLEIEDQVELRSLSLRSDRAQGQPRQLDGTGRGVEELDEDLEHR